MSATRPNKQTIRRGYETRDVDARRILWLAIGFVGFAIVVHLVIAWMLFAMEKDRPNSFAAETPEVQRIESWPQPALQLSPTADLAKFRAEQDQLLHGYGWVDRDKGVVRIPIDRAMDLFLNETSRRESKGGTHE